MTGSGIKKLKITVMFAVGFIEFAIHRAWDLPALALSRRAKSDFRKREGQLCGMILANLTALISILSSLAFGPKGRFSHIWDVAVCG
jgi:hypothetical protein